MIDTASYRRHIVNYLKTSISVVTVFSHKADVFPSQKAGQKAYNLSLLHQRSEWLCCKDFSLQ